MKLLSFELRKHDTSGIFYKDDGQITDAKIKDGKIVNSNITFKKPYRLQVVASKIVGGERRIKKSTMKFRPDETLLNAIAKARLAYKKFMDLLENDIPVDTSEKIKQNMPFSEAWELFVEFKRKTKPDWDHVAATRFYNKWLRKLYNKPINEITKIDIERIKSDMKHPSGEPMKERTKRWVYQWVNPVYTFVNDSQNSFTIKSPARMKGLKRLDNERKFSLGADEIKAVFKRMGDYPVSPFREIFVWLMHGRRAGEVLSLEWSDIDLDGGIYTIRAVNNKARRDMVYILSDRLRETLEVVAGTKALKEMRGYVFSPLKGTEGHLSLDTVRWHWKKIDAGFVLHDIRKGIANYLLNELKQPLDVVSVILGHAQSSAANITRRYGKYQPRTADTVLQKMLDEVLDENFEHDSKITELQKLFPDKSPEELQRVIEIMSPKSL